VLEELLSSPGARVFVDYLVRPETHAAVVLPGVASLAILAFYLRAGKLSWRLQLVWLFALAFSFASARWEVGAETEQLYIFSAFSVACAVLLFWRIYVSPPLAYALTFMSLWCVDVAQAFFRAVEFGVPHRFYVGIGGAGLADALFWVPLLTAAAVAYAAFRIRVRGERLAEF
jgi:hypothetical protein